MSATSTAGFPVNAPITDVTTGYITQAWYYLLFQVWQKLGKSDSDTNTQAYIEVNGLTASFYNSLSGTLLGSVTLTPPP